MSGPVPSAMSVRHDQLHLAIRGPVKPIPVPHLRQMLFITILTDSPSGEKTYGRLCNYLVNLITYLRLVHNRTLEQLSKGAAVFSVAERVFQTAKQHSFLLRDVACL